MSRVQVIAVIALALLVCAAAFRSPATMGRFATRAVSNMSPAQMSPSDVATEATNVLSQFSQVLASESDFGGYAGPAGSLIFIGMIILALAPPLAAPGTK
eukprot:gene1669-3225_t